MFHEVWKYSYNFMSRMKIFHLYYRTIAQEQETLPGFDTTGMGSMNAFSAIYRCTGHVDHLHTNQIVSKKKRHKRCRSGQYLHDAILRREIQACVISCWNILLDLICFEGRVKKNIKEIYVTDYLCRIRVIKKQSKTILEKIS